MCNSGGDFDSRQLPVVAAQPRVGLSLGSRHTAPYFLSVRGNKVPLSVISEAMGHDSETTTQIYLASLDTSAVDNANEKIIKSVK